MNLIVGFFRKIFGFFLFLIGISFVSLIAAALYSAVRENTSDTTFVLMCGVLLIPGAWLLSRSWGMMKRYEPEVPSEEDVYREIAEKAAREERKKIMKQLAAAEMTKKLLRK